MFLLPEGNVILKFADIPRWAEDARTYGVNTVMISGWNVGGHDNQYPNCTPDPKLGTWDVELAEVFFEAVARGAMCNLHVSLEAGTNLHHIVEVSFKAFAKALSAAVRVDPRASGIPSTKGSLVDS